MKLGLTDKEKAERLKYVTATDAPVVCGVSPWGNIIELWKQKVGLSVAPDISSNPAVRAGLYLEAPTAQWFSDETGLQLDDCKELAVHKTISHLAAHTDRVIVGHPAILECKTSSHDNGWGQQGENKVPDYYLIQAAHEAMCFDVERVYIAVLIRGNDFRYYHYDRNDKLEQVIIQRCTEFWDCVKTEEAPTPRNVAELNSLYGRYVMENSIEADLATIEAVHELAEIKEIIKKHEARQKKLEETIKVFMGQNSTLVDHNQNVIATWKAPKPSNVFDAKTFKEEEKELYERYIIQSASSRRFLLK